MPHTTNPAQAGERTPGIVHEHGDFGYIAKKGLKYEVIVNGGTHGVLAGTRRSLPEAVRTLSRLAAYPQQSKRFLGIL